MKYIEVSIYTTHQDMEVLLGFLMTLGITDTAIEDPRDIEDLLQKKETYHWDYVDPQVMALASSQPKITFYLDESQGDETVAKRIEEEVKQDFPNAQVEILARDDSEWKDKWKEFFKPARITDRIVVKPTWEDYESQPGDLIIEIDPGMAFGTGTHETTTLCMKLMEEYLRAGQKVLDVGSGSGILSIGAGLLGASKILGIDIDQEAVKVGRENVELNHMTQLITIEEGDLVAGVDFEADMVVANLMADLVIMLSAHVKAHLLPGGVFISSGILLEKEEEVASAIRSQGFDIVKVLREDMWCAICARPSI